MNTQKATKKVAMKDQIRDIALDISWAKIAQRYFGKSAGWLYHKLDGKNSHGSDIEFTDEEKIQLKEALLDLSDRIALAAKKIR